MNTTCSSCGKIKSGYLKKCLNATCVLNCNGCLIVPCYHAKNFNNYFCDDHHATWITTTLNVVDFAKGYYW